MSVASDRTELCPALNSPTLTEESVGNIKVRAQLELSGEALRENNLPQVIINSHFHASQESE